MDKKNKVTVKEGESLVLKSNGKEYTFDGKNLFVKENNKKPFTATVLKSLRTESGARDWVRVMSERYDGAKIVKTSALKSYTEVDGDVPEGYGYHVIMEQDKDAIQAQKAVVDTLKGLIEAGYMELTEEGPALTDKWTEKVREFTTGALANSLKSVSKDKISITTEGMSETAALIIAAHGEILKAVEDAEKLANLPNATENAEYGHALRPNVSISDEEVSSATQVSRSSAPAADVSDAQTESETVAITDEMADKATHLADHNKGDSGMALGTDETAIKSVDGEESDSVEDEDIAEEVDTKKSAKTKSEKQEEEENFAGKMFVSLQEAKAWNNPDPARWHVVPASFAQKNATARRYSYVVEERDPRQATGAYGNRV